MKIWKTWSIESCFIYWNTKQTQQARHPSLDSGRWLKRCGACVVSPCILDASLHLLLKVGRTSRVYTKERLLQDLVVFSLYWRHLRGDLYLSLIPFKLNSRTKTETHRYCPWWNKQDPNTLLYFSERETRRIFFKPENTKRKTKHCQRGSNPRDGNSRGIKKVKCGLYAHQVLPDEHPASWRTQYIARVVTARFLRDLWKLLLHYSGYHNFATSEFFSRKMRGMVVLSIFWRFYFFRELHGRVRILSHRIKKAVKESFPNLQHFSLDSPPSSRYGHSCELKVALFCGLVIGP